MPKKSDPKLKTESGYYKSHYRANAKYTGESAEADKDQAKVESIRLRVPKGWNQKMKDYVSSSDKYKSVNNMLQELIKKEIPGINEDNAKEI